MRLAAVAAAGGLALDRSGRPAHGPEQPTWIAPLRVQHSRGRVIPWGWEVQDSRCVIELIRTASAYARPSLRGRSAPRRRCRSTRACRSCTSSGCMNPWLSGISRQITRALRCRLNRLDNLVRWAFSMTNTISAHSSRSGVQGTSASLPKPADITSRPASAAKTCSAVGLRSRFRPHRNRMRAVRVPLTAAPASAARAAPRRCR